MSKINENDPAFAIPPMLDPNGQMHYGFDGLTKREYFAAMAMQGMLANNHISMFNENFDEDERAKQFAKDALQCADALIDELNKKQS